MATASSVDRVIYREDAILSLGLLPLLTGLGHLAPSLGGAWAALERPYVDVPCLIMTSTIASIVDAYDKYKDTPLAARPRRWVWLSWMGLLSGLTIWSTYVCGLSIAIRIHRFLLIGMLWGTPCIPTYSAHKGFIFSKPKRLFGEAKSLVVALCMGPVDADTAQAHACALYPGLCAPSTIMWRSIGLSILYNWIRETVCDARDIEEDKRENLRTLPISLGKNNTIALMAVVAFVGDALLSQKLDMEVVIRVAASIILSTVVLQHPRENGMAWSFQALFGLTPCWWAQARLR
ncbi:MAG: hypothetical protein M4579_003205 [Chaenotheca gracillima]|nr:MAG: hypothetical protein M4579_003205 [Chaenotheca gracillima]